LLSQSHTFRSGSFALLRLILSRGHYEARACLLEGPFSVGIFSGLPIAILFAFDQLGYLRLSILESACCACVPHSLKR
jgi:hypothetical protein